MYIKTGLYIKTDRQSTRYCDYFLRKYQCLELKRYKISNNVPNRNLK